MQWANHHFSYHIYISFWFKAASVVLHTLVCSVHIFCLVISYIFQFKTGVQESTEGEEPIDVPEIIDPGYVLSQLNTVPPETSSPGSSPPQSPSPHNKSFLLEHGEVEEEVIDQTSTMKYENAAGDDHDPAVVDEKTAKKQEDLLLSSKSCPSDERRPETSGKSHQSASTSKHADSQESKEKEDDEEEENEKEDMADDLLSTTSTINQKWLSPGVVVIPHLAAAAIGNEVRHLTTYLMGERKLNYIYHIIDFLINIVYIIDVTFRFSERQRTS
jgi:hypothetical protein